MVLETIFSSKQKCPRNESNKWGKRVASRSKSILGPAASPRHPRQPRDAVRCNGPPTSHPLRGGQPPLGCEPFGSGNERAPGQPWPSHHLAGVQVAPAAGRQLVAPGGAGPYQNLRRSIHITPMYVQIHMYTYAAASLLMSTTLTIILKSAPTLRRSQAHPQK